MTSAERAAIVTAQRKTILAGDVQIESDVDYPIAANPLSEDKPFVVTHDITFHVGGRVRTVKAGFAFDGASKPAIVHVLRLLVPLLLLHWIQPSKFRLFWERLFRPLNTMYRNLLASCLHDADYAQQEYEGQKIERPIADACYQSVLIHSGEDYWVARAERIALDWFGGKAWAGHAKRLAEQRRNDHA